jgi:eukaryotic-like serine/threonine-protein kinase
VASGVGPDGDAITDEGHLVAGRYRLLRRIGTGAMGVVWQGHDERLNRPVAVKKLLPRHGGQVAKAVARCLREGRIAARLNHPNATTVFDVVDEDDAPCLVMEYLPSRSLATAVAEAGTLPPDEVAGIGAQVASALAAAHAAGIVHRDITPGNILLGEDGSVKLTDFGISRSADDVTATRSGLIGTPAFLAPEVALGVDPTPASDVFSLGSTLYTAVEGDPPFGRPPNTLALLHAVAGGKINPPRRSGPLTEVLTALLAADPPARPAASEAYELLAAVARGAVPEPVPVVAAARSEGTVADAGVSDETTELLDRPPTSSRPAATGHSHRALAAVGVLVVALVAVGLWLLGGRGSVIPAEERAPADGTGNSTTAPPRENAPVVPVGEPADLDEAPATGTRTSRTTATTPPADAPNPTTADTTTPQPTTTGDALEPTAPVPTTTPPPSTEETTTAPSTPDPAE